MNMFRYYLGRHQILVLGIRGKKALVRHLEEGYVGNKEIGYKSVKRGDEDNTMLRFCWGNKKNE